MTSTLEILDRLVNFHTVSDRSNLELIAYVRDFLVSRGFRITQIDDPELPKAGLYAETGPPGQGIMLSAHSDVVPVDGQNWTRPPFELTASNGRFYGRGTTDMKGYLAEMLAAADRASQMKLREPLKLVISYDEEIGCAGIRTMGKRLKALLGLPRLAIIGEPTSMQVALGHKGKRSYHASFKGEAGHSSLAPQLTSALHLAVDFIQFLRQMQEKLQASGAHDDDYDIAFSTVHAGSLQSGTALNIVPDKADLLFEFRHLSADEPDLLEAQIKDYARALEKEHRGRAAIEITPLAAYPGLDSSPDGPAARLAMQFAQSRTCKVAFGTEAGIFAELGVPSVVCGPGSMEGQGHKADEFITQQQLEACELMLDRVLQSIKRT